MLYLSTSYNNSSVSVPVTTKIFLYMPYEDMHIRIFPDKTHPFCSAHYPHTHGIFKPTKHNMNIMLCLCVGVNWEFVFGSSAVSSVIMIFNFSTILKCLFIEKLPNQHVSQESFVPAKRGGHLRRRYMQTIPIQHCTTFQKKKEASYTSS